MKNSSRWSNKQKDPNLVDWVVRVNEESFIVYISFLIKAFQRINLPVYTIEILGSLNGHHRFSTGTPLVLQQEKYYNDAGWRAGLIYSIPFKPPTSSDVAWSLSTPGVRIGGIFFMSTCWWVRRWWWQNGVAGFEIWTQDSLSVENFARFWDWSSPLFYFILFLFFVLRGGG